MKKLNDGAKVIMDNLVSRLGEEGHVKIDKTDGVFMPVCVEVIGRCNLGRLISVAHYGKQNGDAMRDPDVVFIQADLDGGYYPATFRNDYVNVDQEAIVIRDGRIKAFHSRTQRNLVDFCNEWMDNIEYQQKIA